MQSIWPETYSALNTADRVLRWRGTSALRQTIAFIAGHRVSGVVGEQGRAQDSTPALVPHFVPVTGKSRDLSAADLDRHFGGLCRLRDERAACGSNGRFRTGKSVLIGRFAVYMHSRFQVETHLSRIRSG